IVQLTAVHFHHAGFTLPIGAALSAGIVRRARGKAEPTGGGEPRSIIPLSVAVGVVATAAGITVGDWAEWVGATIMALTGLATGVLILRSAALLRGRAGVLLAVSGASLGMGMTLALGWAWSHRFGWAFLDLNNMARLHGSLNAVGFGLGSMLGFGAMRDGPEPEPASACADGLPRRVALHFCAPDAESLRSLVLTAGGWEPTSPIGLLQRTTPEGYRRAVWSRPLSGSFEDGVHALRCWAGQRAAHLTLAPETPPIEVGLTMAFAFPVLRWLHVSGSCRIIDVIDRTNQYGFTYATLPHHPEDGEESFVVHRLADGTCRYTVTAVWRPSLLMTRVLPPLTGLVQRRAITRYLDGVAAHRKQPQGPPPAQVARSSGPPQG
ncbi:MAG: YndJ family transporter, partial [Acidimicrobiales bacterium]